MGSGRRNAVLSRKVRSSPSDDKFGQKPEGWEEAIQTYGQRVFQAERKKSKNKVPERRVHFAYWRNTKRPIRLE